MGCPRSGTTLLQGISASLLQIECCPQTHYFEKSFSSKKGSRAQRALTSVLRGCYLRAVLPGRIPELNRLDYEIPASRKPGRGWPRTKVVDDFVRLLDSLTLSNGRNVLVEKRPGHILRISTISRYVSRSKVVHILKGGRSVVAFLYAVSRRLPDSWGGRWSVEVCISMWSAVWQAYRRTGGAGSLRRQLRTSAGRSGKACARVVFLPEHEIRSVHGVQLCRGDGEDRCQRRKLEGQEPRTPRRHGTEETPRNARRSRNAQD
jgi:hypothetical protein